MATTDVVKQISALEVTMNDYSTWSMQLKDLSSSVSALADTVARKADKDSVPSLETTWQFKELSSKVFALADTVARKADKDSILAFDEINEKVRHLSNLITKKVDRETLDNKADIVYVDDRLSAVHMDISKKADSVHVKSVRELALPKVDEAKVIELVERPVGDISRRLDAIRELVITKVEESRVVELSAQFHDLSRRFDATNTRLFKMIEVLVDGGSPMSSPNSRVSRVGGGYKHGLLLDAAVSNALLALLKEDSSPTSASATEQEDSLNLVGTRAAPLGAIGRPLSARRPLSAGRFVLR